MDNQHAPIKRSKQTKGDQFVNKVDLKKITHDFITFYYNTWINDVNKLFSHPMWKSYTIINIEGTKLNPLETVQYFKRFEGATFSIENYQYAPDGSRRIDIMSKGIMTQSGITKTLVQTFALIEIKGDFYLKSTQIYFV
ncbi:hypothetical protein crov476 [Cafeteria roenbergensis virus]|uniref:NTF2 domain-containing protein n=1 Tax=Cafeteria roenbergensis virus (strain BV-PW1) TaxID=693272 RepID=E3T5P7_CROVB|nr:hypothetical protein crov476 [Cafeteria roenbergensis virus BV-PW1]ADO67510.1 hypothetical protein crov476 [Cafeteria roenbergensis virus BV-PW1]